MNFYWIVMQWMEIISSILRQKKGTNKTLKIIAKHLHNNGALSHIVVYI